MSSPAPAPTKKPRRTALGRKMLQQQKALEQGKAGYSRADALTDELEAAMKAGKLKLNEPVPLGGGKVGRLIDKFEEKSSCGGGLKFRRYAVEVEEELPPQ